MARYALSDIHGCNTTFRYLIEKELRLQPTDTLYLLGDYIDRGPDSKGVLDYIMELQKEGYQVEALKGNHEDMMLEINNYPAHLDMWLMTGGKEALDSFGVTTAQDIPEVYRQFLEQLKLYIELDDFLLVHAGFNFAAPDPFSDTEAMLWTRKMEVDPAFLGSRKIVHGHTPTTLEQMAMAVEDPTGLEINIDGGCVYKGRFGHLVALDLDTMELIVVPNRE